MNVFALIVMLISIHLAEGFTPELIRIDQHLQNLHKRQQSLIKQRMESIDSSPILNPSNLDPYIAVQTQFVQKCSFSQQKLQGFLFQTNTQIYFAINSPQQNQINIYNSTCDHLTTIYSHQIMQILCDRGVCQSGIIHFITKDQKLFVAYEDKSFRGALQLADLHSENKIVGGVIRHRGKDKIEIYVGEEKGNIRVIDEEGTSKLRLQLEGYNAELSVIADHHPYPLLATKNNWISLLDTVKYAEIAQNCPNLPNLKQLVPENYYGQTFYAISPNTIYVMDLQMNKKTCIIKRQHQLEEQIPYKSKVTYYGGSLYIGNRLYNLTQKKLYKIDGCSIGMSHQFAAKKNQPEQVYVLKECCNEQGCSVTLFDLKKIGEDRSVLFWLTISFILILFVSITFMKKSSISNMDIDDPIRYKQREIQNQIQQLTKTKTKQKTKSKKK